MARWITLMNGGKEIQLQIDFDFQIQAPPRTGGSGKPRPGTVSSSTSTSSFVGIKSSPIFAPISSHVYTSLEILHRPPPTAPSSSSKGCEPGAQSHSGLGWTIFNNTFTAVVNAVPSLLHVANPLRQDLPTHTPDLVQQSNTNATRMVAAPTTAPLSQADHPSVRFWTQADWKTRLKNRSGFSNVDPVNHSAYLEDEEGEPLRNSKTHPTTWGEVTAEADSTYRRGMAALLIEMRLCKDDWKAMYLATHNYPSWYNNHEKKKKTPSNVKSEPKTEGIDEHISDNKKRPVDDEERSSKRFKKATPSTSTSLVKRILLVCRGSLSSSKTFGHYKVTRYNPPQNHGRIFLSGTLFSKPALSTPSVLQPQPASLVSAHALAPAPSANPVAVADSTQREPTHAMSQPKSSPNAAGAPAPEPGLTEPLSEPATLAGTTIIVEVNSIEASSTTSAVTRTETSATPAIPGLAIAATATSRKMTPQRVSVE
ncbi:hypothetical protein GALMADRAFT_145865 [Galerina marginata CBS 339.88]|uniref:Uncharacterized protein n=1 Tax=Galerina marginata (strain CBS 339.88) TaxID=685588 RepID=A0A067SD28_GALM3|nr:hypothetical protein GALMADRAFT_145865 [Galerina marginata CBS 339.88]